MATDLQEKVRGGKAAPKLADAANEAGEMKPVQAPAPLPGDELAALRAENARLRAQFAAQPSESVNRRPPAFGMEKAGKPAFDPSAMAQPAAPSKAHAIGTPGPGKHLIAVELPGHKSRVVDPERGVAVLVKELPVWAANDGEAWLIFAAYNGICGTVQQWTCRRLE
jgi:hypothetical protein